MILIKLLQLYYQKFNAKYKDATNKQTINLSSFANNMLYNTRDVSERTQDREKATWSILSNSRMKLVIIKVNIIKRLIGLQ